MKMGRERAVEDTDILPLKEENTTQGLRDPYYSWQFDHILSHYSTTVFSLRSKRFRVSSSRKLGREQKRGMRGSGRGEKEKLARKAHDFDSANFVWPWKIVSVSVRYLSYLIPMDKKIKTWTLRFLAKENSIVLKYDVEAKYRLISRKFSGM